MRTSIKKSLKDKLLYNFYIALLISYVIFYLNFFSIILYFMQTLKSELPV